MKGKTEVNGYWLVFFLIAMSFLWFPSFWVALLPYVTVIILLAIGIYAYIKFVRWHIKTKQEDAAKLKNKSRRTGKNAIQKR
jgi:ABC-type bacteriocin/lantibiotic exporter with double-glycine peptidase domain